MVRVFLRILVTTASLSRSYHQGPTVVMILLLSRTYCCHDPTVVTIKLLSRSYCCHDPIGIVILLLSRSYCYHDDIFITIPMPFDGGSNGKIGWFWLEPTHSASKLTNFPGLWRLAEENRMKTDNITWSTTNLLTWYRLRLNAGLHAVTAQDSWDCAQLCAESPQMIYKRYETLNAKWVLN
jgi:hypothetical protein